MKCKPQTTDFLTESCYSFHHWKLTVNRLTRTLLVLFRLTGVQTFTVAMSLNRDLKVAEHSFRARFCWYNLARAQGLEKTNMPSIERSFYLLNTRTICAIFLYNWTQCIDGFSLLSQRYVRRGNDAKNPAILSFFFVTERTRLNAAHA